MNWIKLHKTNIFGDSIHGIWVDATNIAWMQTYKGSIATYTHLYWKAIANKHETYLTVSETDEYILSLMRAVNEVNNMKKGKS